MFHPFSVLFSFKRVGQTLLLSALQHSVLEVQVCYLHFKKPKPASQIKNSKLTLNEKLNENQNQAALMKLMCYTAGFYHLTWT